MIDKEQYEGYFADCYVLTNKRTKEFIFSFLDNFIPNRKESADEYEIPQYAENPNFIFKTDVEIIDYLTENRHEIHTIYWANNDLSEIRGAMCFFTNDEQLIVGLYCETNFPDTTIEQKYFNLLQNYCESNNAYITYEEPTMHNSIEFLERMKLFNK